MNAYGAYGLFLFFFLPLTLSRFSKLSVASSDDNYIERKLEGNKFDIGKDGGLD